MSAPAPPLKHRRTSKNHALIRLIDIAIALSALVFFAPLMILIASIMIVADPGPVIFRHRRLGLDGKIFGCLKFRSMVVDADRRLQELLETDADARREWQTTRKLRKDPRITFVGRFLRKSSLDELPQLFNVLRGEMSIVGPRPIVEAEVPYYGRYIAQYIGVRPGITGLWQVSGRNDVSYRRRVGMDVMYARKRSLGLNVKIICLTIPAVMMSRGCS